MGHYLAIGSELGQGGQLRHNCHSLSQSLLITLSVILRHLEAELSILI
jgi:hypothetical protein